MTPYARFHEFVSIITPSKTTDERSVRAHTIVRETLKKDKIFGPTINSTFLGGSYRRKTAIRPVSKEGNTERPDVDIYVVVKDSQETITPKELVQNLHGALLRHQGELNIREIRLNRCSITISTNLADMDISPLLDRDFGGLFQIANRETNEWYPTDPIEHIEWSDRANKRTDGRFNSVVKLCKWTRREFPTNDKHPKSIALEALVEKHMHPTLNHLGLQTYMFYDSIATTYESNRRLQTCPQLDDPATWDGNLLFGVSGNAFADFYEKAIKFKAEAYKGLTTENQVKATKHWRKIFGKQFPSPVSNSEFSSIALKPSTMNSPLKIPTTASRP